MDTVNEAVGLSSQSIEAVVHVTLFANTLVCVPVQVMKPQEAELVSEISKVLSPASLASLAANAADNTDAACCSACCLHSYSAWCRS